MLGNTETHTNGVQCCFCDTLQRATHTNAHTPPQHATRTHTQRAPLAANSSNTHTHTHQTCHRQRSTQQSRQRNTTGNAAATKPHASIGMSTIKEYICGVCMCVRNAHTHTHLHASSAQQHILLAPQPVQLLLPALICGVSASQSNAY